MIFFIHRGLSFHQVLLKLLVYISIVLFSCTGKTTIIVEKTKTAEELIISYAKRLRIEKADGYSQVSVLNPWQGAREIAQKWYLIPEGKITPSFIDSSEVIHVPIKKIICMSTTHLSMISALNEENSVVGFSGTRFIYTGDIVQNVINGDIREIGYEDNLNKELILKLDPDLVMVYGIGSESAGYIGKLKEMGIRVIYNADYLETDPLGKAEWIKLMGALYSKEEMADSIFKTIENEYNNLKSYIKVNAVGRPRVLLGLPFKDTWYISPGNSYISALIKDAGGEYLWQNTESSVSMPTAIENVFLKALKADYWLNTGSANTQDEILSIDPRLARLPCYKSGNLFNNNKRTNIDGGNDYWEGGCLKPQIILRDIASILHPGLLPESELYYYKKINEDQH
jgi:iron complex transport system substrate-binding protein